MSSFRTLAITALILASLVYLWVSMKSDRQPDTQSEESQTLLMYCAAGLKLPVEAIRQQYEKEFGIVVQVNYEGSGTLLSKIKMAPRGDIYLAADESYIAMARQDGLVVESIELATLEPVVAVYKGNPQNITTLDDFKRKEIRFGLANPDAAAIGKITRQVLLKSGHWKNIYPKAKVMKPTVSDLANDIKLQTIDAAIIWDAVANQYPELEIIRVPEFRQESRKVTVGILCSSRNPTVTQHFFLYLSAQDKGLQQFKQFGYQTVQSDAWMDKPALIFINGEVNQQVPQDSLQDLE
jgi:molybdate transport system substrate-binding protein